MQGKKGGENAFQEQPQRSRMTRCRGLDFPVTRERGNFKPH